MLADHVGPVTPQTLWLHEGIAMCAEKSDRAQRRAFIQSVLNGKALIPVDALVRIADLTSLDETTVRFFYAESCALLSLLIEQYPVEHFHGLCRDIRDGYAVEEALRRNYQQQGIETFADLQRQLEQSLVQQKKSESAQQ